MIDQVLARGKPPLAPKMLDRPLVMPRGTVRALCLVGTERLMCGFSLRKNEPGQRRRSLAMMAPRPTNAARGCRVRG